MEKLTQATELIKESVNLINRGQEEPKYKILFGLCLFFKLHSFNSLIKRLCIHFHTVF